VLRGLPLHFRRLGERYLHSFPRRADSPGRPFASVFSLCRTRLAAPIAHEGWRRSRHGVVLAEMIAHWEAEEDRTRPGLELDLTRSVTISGDKL